MGFAMGSVVITGGTGFIGSHLARLLVSEGYSVVLMSRQPDPRMVRDILPNVELFAGDVANWFDVVECFRRHRPEGVFHLATLLGDVLYERPMLGFRANATGTMNILEACRVFDASRYVYSSSIAVFSRDAPMPIRDDAPKEPRDPYGIIKLFSERMSLFYGERFGLAVGGARLAWVFGPGRMRGSTAFSSLIVQNPATGRPVEVPDLTGDWIYVKDAARALLMLYEAEPSRLGYYLFCGGMHSVREVAELVREIIPEARITIKPATPPASLWPTHYDDSIARERLGWRPSYTIRGAIEDFVSELRRYPERYT